MIPSENAGCWGINAHALARCGVNAREEIFQITFSLYVDMRGILAISESTDFSRLIFVSFVVLKSPNELLGIRSRLWFEEQNFAQFFISLV